MKKLAHMLLVIALLVTQIPMTFAATNPFTDVKDSDWFSESVTWAVEQGITTGTSETTFSPKLDCTRGQIVTFLWRAAGEPEPAQTVNPFTDVREKDYFYNAVLWAVENNITTGISATEFGPANVCTREQAVTFMHRAEGKPTPLISTNPFSDVKSTSYAYTPILWAVGFGITNGITGSTFAPASNCTRAQIVTFLYRGKTVTPPSTFYKVTFNSNGGSAVPAQEVGQGKTVNSPETPSRNGYRFDGWYTDAGLTKAYSMSTPVNGPLTLYAKWNNGRTAFESLVNKAKTEGDYVEGVYELFLDSYTTSGGKSYYIGVEYDPSDNTLCGFTATWTADDLYFESDIEFLPNGIGPFYSGILYERSEEDYIFGEGDINPATFTRGSYVDLEYYYTTYDEQRMLKTLHSDNLRLILDTITATGFTGTGFTIADLGFKAYK